MRSSKTGQRRVERARVILLAASGLNGKEIALKMKTRPARISKWLRRFAKERIGALNDSPRWEKSAGKYTSATEKRILKALDEAPLAGYSPLPVDDPKVRQPDIMRARIQNSFNVQLHGDRKRLTHGK